MIDFRKFHIDTLSSSPSSILQFCLSKNLYRTKKPLLAQNPVAFICHVQIIPGPFFVFQVLTFLKLLANLTFLLTANLIIAPISESSVRVTEVMPGLL